MAFGLFSSIQKTATAMAVALTGILLESYGYTPGEVQSEETRQGLNALVSIIPLGALAFSLVVMSAYPLNAQKLIEMRKRLAC